MTNIFKNTSVTMTAMALLLLASGLVFAGGGGTEFTSIYADLTDWTEGLLG